MNITLQGRANFHPHRFGSMDDAKSFVNSFADLSKPYDPDSDVSWPGRGTTPQDGSKQHTLAEDQAFINYVKNLNYIMEDVNRTSAEKQAAQAEYEYIQYLDRNASLDRIAAATSLTDQEAAKKADDVIQQQIYQDANAAAGLTSMGVPIQKSSVLPLLAVAAAAYFMLR